MPIAGFEAGHNILIDPITSTILTDDALSINMEVQRLGGRTSFVIHNLRKENIVTAKGRGTIPNTPSEGYSKTYGFCKGKRRKPCGVPP